VKAFAFVRESLPGTCSLATRPVRARATKFALGVVVGLATAAAMAGSVGATGPGALRDLAGCQANVLPRNDDLSTGLVSLPFSIDFFDHTYAALYVNNNGNVTFGAPLSDYTPYPLNTTTTAMIAPFFGDVDTRPVASDVVTYGETVVDGHTAFCVNWAGVEGVGYYNQQTDKLNKFQLLLIDRSDVGSHDFDIEMNYDQIQWETGDASSGVGGDGGTSARMGYTNGDATHSYEDAGSGINGAFLDSNPDGLTHRSQATSQLGRFLFPVRSGTVYQELQERPLPKLIFVAGIAGNEIRKSDCTFFCAVWPQVLATARYGSDLEVAADGETPLHATEGGEVFDSVFGHEVYRNALNFFRAMACEGGACLAGNGRLLRDFDTFHYDWRIGDRTEGQRFADRLETECGKGPVWLVVHSTGGLILKSAFHYLRLRGINPKTCLDRGGVFFLATPHLGAPKAVGALVSTRNFFLDSQPGADSLNVLTRDVNNWLTAWQLMARTEAEDQLETYPWYLKPPPNKMPREPWFSSPRANEIGQPLNFALDEKAATREDFHYQLADTIGDVPYYDVFGYHGLTQGSYAPETCTKQGNHPRFVHSDTDARVDGVIWGDTTVPTWSASWPGQLTDSKHLYGIPDVAHGKIPSAPAVLNLIKTVVTSGNPTLYPNWANVHGGAAVDAAHPTNRPQYLRATWCSPVAARAVLDGQISGIGDDGELHQDIPNSMVDIAGSPTDPQPSVFTLSEAPFALPTFTTRATGAGSVGFIFATDDEVDHSFMFDVQPGDTSRFVNSEGTWRLLIDRGDDGSTDQTVELGAPSVDFDATSPLLQGLSQTLTARQRGEVATGSYVWSVSGSAASLVANGASATITGVTPGNATVSVAFTSASGVVSSYSRTIVVDAYAPAGTTCAGEAGHAILQPVNADGTSVFKAGSTVPVQFRVCDSAGNSVGASGVVRRFTLTKKVSGTVVSAVNETPVSTTPDTSFRFDTTAQKWIFNLSTKNLATGTTYTYTIELSDGGTITFSFGLR
jgi:hypothetical protein